MIVLAILALLAGIVIFVVKPGNILDNVKDATRVSDLNNISKSINYLNTIQLGLLNLGSPTTVYVSLPDNTSTTCSSYALPSLPTGYTYTCKNSTDYRKNDGNGWVPINFRESDNSNILSSLPVDPTNNITYYYTYFPGGSFELTAQLTKARDSSLNDNGNSTLLYETGTPNHVSSPIVRDTGLIIYFKYNEGTGVTTFDYSGHNHTGTLMNGQAWASVTSGERVMYNIEAGDTTAISSFALSGTVISIEVWMKSHENPPTLNQGITGDSSFTDGYLRLYRYSLNLLAYAYNGGIAYKTDYYAGLDDQWIYITVVCDYANKKYYAYRNGTLFGSVMTLSGTPLFPSTARSKYVGNVDAGGYGTINGYFDEFRLYTRALSAEEVMARYNQTKGRYQ